MDQKTKEQISAYHDGELDAAEMAEVRALIMRDPKAKAYLGELQELSTQLASMPIRPAPSDLANAVLDHVGLEGAPDSETTTQSAASAKLRAVAASAPVIAQSEPNASEPQGKVVRLFDRRWFPSAAAACLVVAAAAATYIYQEVSDRSTERMMNTLARDEAPMLAPGSAIESFGAMPMAKPEGPGKDKSVAKSAETAGADADSDSPVFFGNEAVNDDEARHDPSRGWASDGAVARRREARTGATVPQLALDLSLLPIATLSAAAGSTSADAIFERALRHFEIRAGGVEEALGTPNAETGSAHRGSLGAPKPKSSVPQRDDDAKNDGNPVPTVPSQPADPTKPDTAKTDGAKPDGAKPDANDGKELPKSGERLRDQPVPPKSSTDTPRAEPPASVPEPAARANRPADAPPPPSSAEPTSGGGLRRAPGARPDTPLSDDPDIARADAGEAAKLEEADTSLYRVLSRQANPAGGEDVVVELPKSKLDAFLRALRFESADAGGTFSPSGELTDAAAKTAPPAPASQPAPPAPEDGSAGRSAPESGSAPAEAKPAPQPAAEERVRIVIRLR